MATAAPRWLLVLAFTLLGLFYLGCVAMVGHNAIRDFSPARMADTLSQIDYGRFWYAGQRFLWRLGDPFALSPAALRQPFPIDTLSTTHVAALPWPYPPPMTLLAMLVALMPLRTSFVVWSAATVLGGALLMRRAGLGWAPIILGLLSPADLYNLADGQNGALFGSLQVACLLALPKSPGSAGIVAGGFVCKPQLGFAVLPVILQNLKRMGAAAALVAAICLILSTVLEGAGAWAFFLHVASPVTVKFLTGPFPDRFPIWSISVYFMARSFGATVAWAFVCQAVAAILSLVLIFAAWRTSAWQPLPRLAFTLCLSSLITPYEFITDLVGFAVAMAAMFFTVPDGRKLIFATLWLMTGYSIYVVIFTGHVIFPVLALIGAACSQPFTPFGHRSALTGQPRRRLDV